MDEPDRASQALLSRRDAALALAAMGVGFAVLGLRSREPVAPIVRTFDWQQVSDWTLRLPVFPQPLQVPGFSTDDVDSVLGHLPADPAISWSSDGVRTHLAQKEVVRVLRARIADDLSHGRVELTSGWGLARTEWILLQLAAGPPRLTADAARP